MRALIQRTKEASVTVDGKTIGAIGLGLLVFLGVAEGDSKKEADYLVDKIVNLRIFPGEKGHFDRSLLDTNAGVLIVSQFTLYGSTKKGRRPDFSKAAKPEEAERLYKYFVQKMRETGLAVETGEFQAMMDVELINDGPVTFLLES